MANDADVQDIRDNVEKLNDNIETMAKNGVKVNGNSFNRLSAIVTMETRLGEVSENTQHISESLDKNGDIYDVLDKIREQAAGIKNFLGTNNQHITSAGSGATITNATNSGENLGGFSDVINKIYDEIKTFREQVLTALDVEKSISGGTVDDIADKLRAFNDAKEKVEKEKSEKDHKEKSSKEYWKKKKKEEKEEERARNRAEHKGLKDGLGTAKNIALGISQGTNFDGVVNGLTSKLSNFGPWGAAAGGIIQVIKGLFDLYAKVDKEASDYARIIGGSGAQKRNIFSGAQRIARDTKALYGINQEDILKQAKETAEAFGRNVSHLSDESLRVSVMLKKMGIEAQVLGTFDTYGKSIQETDVYFKDLYQNVSKRGISFKNVAKAVNDNLKAAQNYNFSNGLKGLQAMAEKSTQFKFNMQQAFTFADRVSTFEGAIETAAKLSVLGGSFGNFANPMQMMYEGLNDVEALQERMIKTFGQFARYDTEKNEIIIDPTTKTRIKEAAKAMGVDPGEMISMTMAQERYRMVESQLTNKSQFKNKETIDFIKNLSEIRDGIAYITLNGKEKRVSDLTQSDADAIASEQRAYEDKTAATMGDIFVHTKGIGEKLDDILKYITTRLGVLVAKIAGVGFTERAQRKAWRLKSDEEKEELIKNFGSRKAAKAAFGMGQAEDYIDKILTDGRENISAEAARYYFNSKKKDLKKEFELVGEDEDKVERRKRKMKDFRNAGDNYKNTVYFEMLNAIAKKEGYTIENVPMSSNTQNGNYTISNVSDSTSNPLKVSPVSPIGPEKIELNGLNVKIDGKIDLTSGDKSKTLDISKLSQTDIDKLTAMIYKQVYTEISKKIEHGYNKENYPFRGA